MEDPRPTITVGRAVISEVPRLSGLLAILFSQEAEFAPDTPKQQRGLRMILEQPETGIIFRAEAAGDIIGMVSILFSISTAEGGRVAWLEDMIVHPRWQGHGVGTSLLEHALRAAREAGCLRVTLLADLTNGDAMRFYARSGFSRSAMTPMRLKLQDVSMDRGAGIPPNTVALEHPHEIGG